MTLEGKFTQTTTPFLEFATDASPGLVGIASGYLGRYREFDHCIQELWVPEGSHRRYAIGVGICHNLNELIRYMLARENLKWIFFLGDDHVFRPDIFSRLYSRNVDVVVPLCLHRDTFMPVFNKGENGGFKKIPDSWKFLKGKTGIMELETLIGEKGVCGNSGMLIRRSVFDKLEEPWYRSGQMNPEYDSSDIYFTNSIQKAGFKIYVDLDNPIGHINHMAIWPKREEDGSWSVEFYNA